MTGLALMFAWRYHQGLWGLKGMRSKLTAIAFLLLLPVQADFAAECKQEKAIYSDRDGAYELKFEAVGSECCVLVPTVSP